MEMRDGFWLLEMHITFIILSIFESFVTIFDTSTLLAILVNDTEIEIIKVLLLDSRYLCRILIFFQAH